MMELTVYVPLGTVMSPCGDEELHTVAIFVATIGNGGGAGVVSVQTPWCGVVDLIRTCKPVTIIGNETVDEAPRVGQLVR